MSNIQETQTTVPSGTIDLGLGDPQLSTLPLELIRTAARSRLERGDRAFLQYGVQQGDGRFRQALAGFLSRSYGAPVDPERLFITNGASGALDLVCSLYTQPGDTVFVEEPSYFLALKMLKDHGLRLVPVETDADGLSIESLEQRLAQVHPKFLYTVPTFQNPSGRTLSRERRQRLAALSRERDFLVVADEVYHGLAYAAPPPPALALFTEAGNVISLGSFSKILAPGLRLGWVQSDAGRIERLANCGLLESGGGLNPFASAIAGEILESGGLEANLARLISVHRARIAAMHTSLRKHLPQAEYSPPQGGYFFWVRLPGVDTIRLQMKAREFEVDFRPGPLFSSRDGLHEYLRVCFVFNEAEQSEEGLARLGRCLKLTRTGQE